LADLGGRFWRISTAGIFFQGGAAAIDPNTVVPTLVHGLTGSSLAVGAAVGTVRFGWLFPQLFVAYYAQRRARRLPLYMLGAFGRVACLAGVAALLWLAGRPPGGWAVASFFVLWTIYSFVSGIVAVPYNDIVARSIPSAQRSRMLALRFFGGGLLALAVAGAAHRMLEGLAFPGGYAALLLFGAALLLISAVFFVTAGEPAARVEASRTESFLEFLRLGVDTFVEDRRFRLFLFAQWLGATAAMSLPFYILQTQRSAPDVAFLLGAQTAGALASNPLWGWWGDRRGKRELLEAVAATGVVAPLLAIAWIAAEGRWAAVALPYFAVVFVVLGAVGNGSTIAYLGYLMEISPDDRRPAYSGYFNTLAAPAALLPMAGGALAAAGSFVPVFAVSAVAAALQFLTVWRLRRA
jgi:MFS family permease